MQVLPEAQSQWLHKTDSWRRQYEELKNQASHHVLCFGLKLPWFCAKVRFINNVNKNKRTLEFILKLVSQAKTSFELIFWLKIQVNLSSAV